MTKIKYGMHGNLNLHREGVLLLPKQCTKYLRVLSIFERPDISGIVLQTPLLLVNL